MILLRHGRPAAPGTCYGRSDPELAEPPRRTAGRVAAALPDVDRCFASPAARCLELAQALAGTGPVEVVPALQELDFGDWEGRPWDEVDRAGLDAWAAAPLDHRMPGGESGRDLARRVRGWVDEVGPLGQHDLVVAHAGSLRALAAVVREVPFDSTWRWPVAHATPLRLGPTGFVPVVG